MPLHKLFNHPPLVGRVAVRPARTHAGRVTGAERAGRSAPPPGEPLPPADGEGPGLTVAAVARRLGVAPATLRTWDRRYGLGPGAHDAGTRRRYRAQDLARLELMRRLVVQGVAPADAAAAALAEPLPDTPGPGPLRAAPDLPEVAPGAGHGGRVLALPGAGHALRGLARAVMALDEDTARGLLVTQLRTVGVVATWETLLRPLLRALGERWASTGEGVETEHLLSLTTVLALREARSDAAPRPGRPVLLASAEDEQHTLPLHVVEAALAERQVPARTLGAAIPAGALQSAVARTGPAAVLVWSQFSANADAAALDRLPQTRPLTAQFVGGPGWSGATLPRRARLLGDLTGAVQELSRAAGAA